MPNAIVYETSVRPDWVDYNGHMRDAYYALVFSLAVDGVQDTVGIDASYRQSTRCTMYVVEMHNFYIREVKEGDQLRVESLVLDCDSKRYHLYQRMMHDDQVVAVCESLQLHVSQSPTPRAAIMPQPIQEKLRGYRLTGEHVDELGFRSRPMGIRQGGS